MAKRKEEKRREGEGREEGKGRKEKEQPNEQRTVCHYTLALGLTGDTVYILIVNAIIFCKRCSVVGMFFLSHLFRLHSLLLPNRSSVILTSPHSVPTTYMEGFWSSYE